MKPTTTSLFGTSDPPQVKALLPYPDFLLFETITGLNNALCYIVRHYGRSGFSIYVARRKKQNDVNLTVIASDWNGNKIDLATNTPQSQQCLTFMSSRLKHLIELMATIRLDSAQYYIANVGQEQVLVDLRLNENKFSGPGMLRDLFGKAMPIQEVIKITNIDENTKNLIKTGFGAFAGDLIIKPSSFKINSEFRPYYVELKRG